MLAVGRARQVGEVERADAEHLAGALGVAGRDDRRVDPEEAALVEEAVDRHASAVAHARDRAEACSCAAAGARPRAGTRSCAASAESDRCRDRRPSRPPRPTRAWTSTAWPLPWLATSVAGRDAPRSRWSASRSRSGSSAASAGATTWIGSKHEPSWTWRNDSPAFESRRVRTQPRTVTAVPTGNCALQDGGDIDAMRSWLDMIAAVDYVEYPDVQSEGWNDFARLPEEPRRLRGDARARRSRPDTS